jgi:GntR family transcriptional regulator, transcriptional repressor for pyruvate dehydrogenase complex
MVEPLSSDEADTALIRKFEPIQKQRNFEEILVQLQAAFANGQLSPGDRLPAERELAEQFGASRSSVREALRVLEALGVVQVKPGADNGAFLLAEPGRAFRDLLQYQLALRQIDVASLVEFRIVIESWAARTAAERADEGALNRMDELIDLMKQAPASYTRFHDYDADWHLELARSTRNDLFALALEGARTTIERAMVGAVAGLVNWDTMKARMLREHVAILEAVRNRDGALASELMTAHIRDFYNEQVFSVAGQAIKPMTPV